MSADSILSGESTYCLASSCHSVQSNECQPKGIGQERLDVELRQTDWLSSESSLRRRMVLTPPGAQYLPGPSAALSAGCWAALGWLWPFRRQSTRGNRSRGNPEPTPELPSLSNLRAHACRSARTITFKPGRSPAGSLCGSSYDSAVVPGGLNGQCRAFSLVLAISAHLGPVRIGMVKIAVAGRCRSRTVSMANLGLCKALFRRATWAGAHGG